MEHLLHIFRENPAMVVALVALLYAVFQGWQNHKHNKLSLRPLLTLTESTSVGGNKRFITASIVNNGVGPAIIKDFMVRFGDVVKSHNNSQDCFNFLREKRDGIIIIPRGYCIPDSVIKANEAIDLWEIKYENTPQNREFIRKMSISVKYQSIYQAEVFSYNSKVRNQFIGYDTT